MKAMTGWITTLGGWCRGVARDVGGVLDLGRETGRALPRIEGRPWMTQTFELANRSIFFITVIMSFVGAILVVQACIQARRIIGDLSPIGPTFLQLLVREFGPTIVALMVAARYGAGVGAEVGAMKITEQVDALRLAGATPAGFLVAPRVLAGVVGMLPLVIFGTGIAFVAGAVAARVGFGLGYDQYFGVSVVSFADLTVGVLKSFAFGAVVPLVACFAGLQARGGAPGVGRATTYAVIGGSLGVLFVDFVLGAIALVVERAL